MLEPFELPFVQRGLVEVLILAVPAGLLGTWIVLRGLAFFSHAIGPASFPGLVVADGLGFAAPLGAFGAAILFAGGALTLRGRRSGPDAVVALVLVACLAAGVILASDVFGSGSNIETLLFGSLLLVDSGDIALAAAVAAATVLASGLIGQHWLRAGFDPGLPSDGPDARLFDAVLIVLIALAGVAALTVVGALLITALFLIPAVTARLLTERLHAWQLLSVALVAIEGAAGLWLSVKANAPAGATIACVAGGVLVAVVAGRAIARLPRAGLAAVVLAGLALLGAGCGGSGGDDSGDGETVAAVATTTQVGDFVRQVGGEAVEVHQVLQPNSDPHDYEARPADVQAVADAEVVFASGDGLDEWIEDVVADSGSEAEIVDLGAAAPIRLPSEEDQLDPHWWHDPRNVEAAAGEIATALSAVDPSAEARFEANADAYVAELEELDAAIAACLDSVPAERRKLVTDHDAFNYFANRYEIEVVGAVIPSQTTQAQASAKELSELADTIEAEEVRAIFPESSLGPRVAEAIAGQTGVTTEYTLYGDALGPEGSDGATYVEMEEANANAVVRGFTGGQRGCQVKP